MIANGLVKVKSNTPGLGGLFVVYQGSALNEEVGKRGLSHLYEHMACCSFEHLQDELQSSSVSWNAYTSDNNVVFYWTGLNRKIEEYQKELIKVTNYLPTREQFDRERAIVIQEYKDALSNKNFLFSNIERKYFNYYGPIGYLKDLEEVTYEEMMDFIVMRYVHPTAIIRIGESETIDDITKNYQYQPIKKKLPHNILSIPNDADVERTSSFPTSKLIVDWVEVNDVIDVRDVLFLKSMWSSGLNSPLYKEIREKRGLVYGLGLHLNALEDDNLQMMFWSECSPDKDEEIRSVLQECMSNVEEHITQARFDIVKNSFICSFEKNEILNYNDISNFLEAEERIVNKEYLENLTFDKIESSAKLLSSLFATKYHKADISSEVNV
jgi:predicted Zn-dependent peptidase